MKRPSFQFYPADWRTDASLQVCSLEARGLWVEILCLLHDLGQKEGARYGHLEMNGVALDWEKLSRLVGIDEELLTELMQELEGAGVFSRDEGGVIYSRRFARDEVLKQVRAKAGSKGGSKTQAKPKQRRKQSSSKGARVRARVEDEDEEEEEDEVLNIKEIVDLYHLLCPALPMVKALTPPRRKAIKARLKEKVDFREVFTRASASDFLTGQTKDGFVAGFDFLINQSNIVKTLEGKYDNRNPSIPADRDYEKAFS